MDINSLLAQLAGTLPDDKAKLAVWNKALAVPGRDARVIRKDACGAWIKWTDFGKTTSDWGWEIDHIIPKAWGGSDHIDNLQALHWRNNRAKGDSPILACPITAVH